MPALVVNPRSVRQVSPFRYPGGKSWLVPRVRRWIASLPARPSVLVEPFAGGASVGLSVLLDHLAERVVLAELDPAVASVWRVLAAGQGPELAARVRAFRPTPEEVEDILAGDARRPVDLAFATIVRNRTRFGGILHGACAIRRGEDGRGIGSRWYPDTIADRLLAVHAERHRLEAIEGDGLAVIERHTADPRAAFFIDPPYSLAGGKGAGRRLYSASALDHARLFALAASVRGDVLLTYDDAPAARSLAAHHGLAVAPVPMRTRASVRQDELLIGRDLRWLGDEALAA